MISEKRQIWLIRGLFIFVVLFLLFIVSYSSFASWTPLVSPTDFDGIKADVTTLAVGIVSVMLIVIGIGVLIKVFR